MALTAGELLYAYVLIRRRSEELNDETKGLLETANILARRCCKNTDWIENLIEEPLTIIELEAFESAVQQTKPLIDEEDLYISMITQWSILTQRKANIGAVIELYSMLGFFFIPFLEQKDYLSPSELYEMIVKEENEIDRT